MFRSRLATALGRYSASQQEEHLAPAAAPLVPPSACFSSIFMSRLHRSLHDSLQRSTALVPSSKSTSALIRVQQSPVTIHSMTTSIAVRRPRAGSTIHDSPFCPRVLASDRIRLWSMPFSEDHLRTSSLPHPLLDNARTLIFESFAPATHSAYAAGPLQFTQFCDQWHVPEQDCMPVSPALLTAFVAEFAGSVSGRAINNWLSGIRVWHTMSDMPWPADHEWLHLSHKSAALLGHQFCHPRRAPVSLLHLCTLHQSLDTSIPLDACIWAVALTAFFGCRHLGELLPTSPGQYSPDTVVSRSSMYIATHSLELPLMYYSFWENMTLEGIFTSFVLHLPWTKTTRELVHTHLATNVNLPASALFFSFSSPDMPSGYRILTKSVFLARCTAIWSQHSLDHVLGHSFRIGGAVELLLAGVPPEVVAATGGWTSLAFLTYWCRMEDILPMSTSHAYSAANISQLSRIFESYRSTHHLHNSLDTHTAL
ncbi:hypothetical protein FISHEDRAFT_75416 [Fistulina hepatica ATCC 64428]|uniref:DNA breaking-rejoining enzyme n=1 Tax=Fistulina hepatica ATCC 64428 TaxID=1128425 RepID=A0A0D7A7B7_9AGAR|nr:hypothetical protein FISHEDRAFT_75416 [Fistulina hepatica ATCC 64428]